MPDTQPRELTALELQQLQAPPATGGGDAAPLTVPPGTSLPVHLIDATAGGTMAAPAQPTQEPPAQSSGGG